MMEGKRIYRKNQESFERFSYIKVEDISKKEKNIKSLCVSSF